MIREAPTANRYVQEAENERQYQKHVNAIKNMKPSINTHADIKNKDLKSVKELWDSGYKLNNHPTLP